MLEALKAKLADLYAREPARVNAAVVTAVLAIAGAVGLVFSAGTVAVVGSIAAIIVPIVVAELTRPKVVPVAIADEAIAAVSADSYHAGREDAEKSLPPDSLGP